MNSHEVHKIQWQFGSDAEDTIGDSSFTIRSPDIFCFVKQDVKQI